jgi:Domain of unknown function DUF29
MTRVKDKDPNPDNFIAHIEARADTGARRVIDHGYNTDLARWAEGQAAALRAAAGTSSNQSIDWENLAEEIEALGKSQERDLGSRITTILVHLIKLEASPATQPRAGWRETIQEQRDEITDLLADTPSLVNKVPTLITERLPRGRTRAKLALAEYDDEPRVDIDSLVYSEDQVRGPWFPDA